LLLFLVLTQPLSTPKVSRAGTICPTLQTRKYRPWEIKIDTLFTGILYPGDKHSRIICSTVTLSPHIQTDTDFDLKYRNVHFPKHFFGGGMWERNKRLGATHLEVRSMLVRVLEVKALVLGRGCSYSLQS
jgi:hypothetical protein